MKIKVLHANMYPPKYLRHVARRVYELIHHSTITQRYQREEAYFIGPDGIQFCIRENKEGFDPVVYVKEDHPGFISICVPKFETHEPSESFRIPPWLEPASDYSCIGAVLPFFGPLYFGQVSLADAAQLFNVPVGFLEENFINEQNDEEEPVSLLSLSVTRPALNPHETYVDIRGLIAWLILDDHVRLDE